MKHTLTKAAAVAALAAGALFAVPTAANAYTPPATGEVSDGTVEPGGTFSFFVTDPAFLPGEPVTISLTGENASGASLAFIKMAVETNTLGTVSANAEGGLDPVSIQLPSNASGTYTILATSPSNPTGVTAYVTVAAASSGDAGDDDDSLATTGANSDALLTLWIGGGALVLAGGGVAVASAVRRNRNQVTAA